VNIDGLPSARSWPDVPDHHRTKMLHGELSSWLDHRRVAAEKVRRPGTIEELTYHPSGRLATEQVNAGTPTEYTYDAAGQLTEADGATGYTYGTRGNRLTQTAGTTTTNYTTNPNGSVATATTGSVTITYDYDEAGRRTTKTTDTGPKAGTVTTTYDTRGKPVTETHADADNMTVHRRYDGNGTLTGHTLDYPGGDFIFTNTTDTTQAVPTLVHSTLNGVFNLRSIVANRLLAAMSNGTGAWYKHDVRDSPIKPTNNTNVNQVAPDSYDPYGNRINPQPNTYGIGLHGPAYRSEHQLGDTLHLRNREYDPTTGQFTTQDPLDGIDGTPTAANPYHYTDNDPLNKVDPLGLRPTDCSDVPLVALAGRMRALLRGQLPRTCAHRAEYRYSPWPSDVGGRIAYTNPDGDGCSGGPVLYALVVFGPTTPAAAKRAFREACLSHDYGYDLVRAAMLHPLLGEDFYAPDLFTLVDWAATSARLSADRVLNEMMGDVCGQTGYLGLWNKISCQSARKVMYTGLTTWTAVEGPPK
jgi:RHS repeat-associated protein